MERTILNILRAFFALIFGSMLLLAITATIDQSMFEAVGKMWPNWWFRATLADAYFGFLTFFVWVAYKELRLWRKLVWFASIMLLGNLAISVYMLLELSKLKAGDTLETLLTRRNG
jgi:predicted permease